MNDGYIAQDVRGGRGHVFYSLCFKTGSMEGYKVQRRCLVRIRDWSTLYWRHGTQLWLMYVTSLIMEKCVASQSTGASKKIEIL